MPNRQTRRRLAVMGGLVLIGVAIVYGATGSFFPGPGMGRQDRPAAFQSNGERIYFTAASASGSAITSTGGGMHMRMNRAGCVTCHGVDRQGRRLMPRFWKVAPPLTPQALFDEHDEGAGDDGHGDHEGYNDETLRRAITQGLDPDGKRLDPAMPRWSMSAPDLADLIAFLKKPGRD